MSKNPGVSKSVDIKPRNYSQEMYLNSIKENDITFGIGPAGTGKTLLAVLAAIDAYENGEVDKILISRPAVTADEEIGFLPGTAQEKLDPYMRPIYDAMNFVWSPTRIQDAFLKEELELAPVGFMRGRSFYRSFIIMDEAQNLTRQQMKMVLTRFGEGCKMVINGDPTQCDLPFNPHTNDHNSGVTLIDKLVGIRGLGVVSFSTADVVRHRIVADIVKRL